MNEVQRYFFGEIHGFHHNNNDRTRRMRRSSAGTKTGEVLTAYFNSNNEGDTRMKHSWKANDGCCDVN